MQPVSAIIVAAGTGTRMGGVDKQLLPLCGKPILLYSVELFCQLSEVMEVVIVTRKDLMEEISLLVASYQIHKPIVVVQGGDTRQQSVAAGVFACQANGLVAIHDAARPLLTTNDARAVFADAGLHQAAALGVPVKDTIKRVNDKNSIVDTLNRAELYAVQTPQVFVKQLYLTAMEAAKNAKKDYTDDCQLVEALGITVQMTVGNYQNIKVTTPEDLTVATGFLTERTGGSNMRIGHGYDVHRLVEGRDLILGGVTIPHITGLLGHSDADVLLHAITDALLGAAGFGDIGKHFPDTDPQYKGADSLKLLQVAVALLQKHGYTVQNIDATVVAQAPKLASFLPMMKDNIATVCNVDPTAVNIKATTEEKLGFTGELLGISAHAVALIG